MEDITTGGKKAGAFIMKVSRNNKGEIYFRNNFALHIFKVTVACNYFNLSAYLTTGEAKKKSDLGLESYGRKFSDIQQCGWSCHSQCQISYIRIISYMLC